MDKSSLSKTGPGIHSLQARLFLGAALLSLASLALAQQTHVEYSLGLGPEYLATHPSVTVNNPTGTVSATGGSVGYVGGHSNGVGTFGITSSVAYGTAKASAGGSGGGYSGDVVAGWDDVVTFGGGTAGSTGTVQLQLGYNWSLGAASIYTPGFAGSASINAYADMVVSPVGSTPYVPYQSATFEYAAAIETYTISCGVSGACGTSSSGVRAVAFGQGVPGTPLAAASNQLATFTFDIVFGQAYNITPEINIDFSGANSASSLDASHSLNWMGIAGVFDDKGNAIAGYSVASASGFDYASAVPEPESLVLMLAGLGVLQQRARRRRGNSPRLART